MARLRADFALTDTERLALTPQNLNTLTQDQVDQIYARLCSDPIPTGRSESGRASVVGIASRSPTPASIAQCDFLPATLSSPQTSCGTTSFRWCTPMVTARRSTSA